MRVAFIAPPFCGRARGLPLGLAYLAAVLEAERIEVRALDMTVSDSHDEALSTFLDDFAPDIVGISVVCATYLDGIFVAEQCKAVLGLSTTVIMGGPHVSYAAETILKRHDSVDICVLGETEESIAELLRALMNRPAPLASVPGIAFRDIFGVHFTASKPLAKELDLLPLPARHRFDIRRYRGDIGGFEMGPFEPGSQQKTELIASRGCPYPCNFCSTKEFWQRKYRKRSPEHVVSELALLVSAGYSDLYFNDDIFTIQRRWVLDLCSAIRAKGLSIRWACGTRVDAIDPELLRAMRDAGCVYIYFGVETGSDIINAGQEKGATVQQIEKAYDLLREFGIYSSAALIFGLPGETWDTAKHTIDWIRNIVRPDEVWISKASCYPGTQLARFYSITAEDYEVRVDGHSKNGLLYGTGGIYTPFFLDDTLVQRIWSYLGDQLGHLNLGFGDD